MTASLRNAMAVLAALLGGVACGVLPAAADIKASSVIRYYMVPGTTAPSLRRAIAGNALRSQIRRRDRQN